MSITAATMRLHIVHTTTYRYRRAVHFGPHRLVLRPREGHDLRVERMHLELSPAHHLQWTSDIFGNSVALVEWTEESDTLSIANDVIVERHLDAAPRERRTRAVPWPPTYDTLELPVVQAYLSASFPESAGALRGWLDTHLGTQHEDAGETMQSLCAHVFHAISYKRRLEKGVQLPAHTLELGSGSCRDLATLMMDAARMLGVAARFASGYLHCASSMAGHASTHAWAEVYLPQVGWRGFDPTIGTATTPRHVVTGVSSHPRGVMPVSGTFVGRAGELVDLHVTVLTEELSPVALKLLSRHA